MHAIAVMSRRDVLRTGGALVVSFMFGAGLPQRSLGQEPGASIDLGKPLDLKEVDSFLAVHADGSVTIYTSKVDVGTGLRLAMSQMVAEELGVPTYLDTAKPENRPYYASFGFREVERVLMTMPDGVSLEGVAMERPVAAG